MRKISNTLLISLSALFVVGTVSAATTISTDISTGGQLSVTGTSTFLGIVGIGTTSPAATLGIQGSVGVSDSQFYLASNGNVGIGTSSPNSMLTLETSGGSINPNIFLNKASFLIPNFSSALSTIGLNSTSSTFFIISTASNANGGGAFYGFTKSGVNNAVPIIFSGHHGGSSPTTPAVRFDAWKHDGGTSRSLIADNEIIASFTNGGVTKVTILGSGNVGIGASTPTTQLQVATSTANATTSLEFGKAGQNKGSCLVMYDVSGNVQYVSIQNGSFVISSTSCK